MRLGPLGYWSAAFSQSPPRNPPDSQPHPAFIRLQPSFNVSCKLESGRLLGFHVLEHTAVYQIGQLLKWCFVVQPSILCQLISRMTDPERETLVRLHAECTATLGEYLKQGTEMCRLLSAIKTHPAMPQQRQALIKQRVKKKRCSSWQVGNRERRTLWPETNTPLHVMKM